MSRMYDDLRGVLDEIERSDDWAYRFVTDILERREKDPDYKLSPKQFKKLDEIHQKYVKGWR